MKLRKRCGAAVATVPGFAVCSKDAQSKSRRIWVLCDLGELFGFVVDSGISKRDRVYNL